MSTTPRRRADALRNRQQILAAAKRLYAAGEDAGPERVAREAGVGVGTLYRHFPNREALAAAVYDDELTLVANAADELLAGSPPAEALRGWMDRFARRLEDKRAMGDAMRALVASDIVTAHDSRARLAEAAQRLLDAGIAEGVFRAGSRGDDLVAALLGVHLACPETEHREQAGRLMDLVAAGFRA
ncbi:TetR/AcrR family transcriptional regulator [Amycolatopsis sp. K13G38]|uniref:TetR/AcrR family transcriptional regulator n=1 Tax=Amycolatopsis acididurans TaxID=2724524 RepID=A0ABX1IZQ0_9PSEU|nr:TetR/AcrR family transcriptional regulator [Amycolatopsis acididurans]NKQ52209.1 TetR/AcrR family transcriptional regulator [Amycolatopsis acididurans]